MDLRSLRHRAWQSGSGRAGEFRQVTSQRRKIPQKKLEILNSKKIQKIQKIQKVRFYFSLLAHSSKCLFFLVLTRFLQKIVS